jgi:hypothetical protein
MIFFDKATTITRLVGYQQSLECIRAQVGAPMRYVGLENALALMRANEAILDAKLDYRTPNSPTLLGLLLLRTRNRYWMINWYTFAILSLVVCTLGFNFLGTAQQTVFFPFGANLTLPERTLWGSGAFGGFGLVAIYTFLQIWRLTAGNQSYDAYAKKWAQILAR